MSVYLTLKRSGSGCVGVCVCARTRLRSVREDSRNVTLAVVFVIVSEG